MDWHRSAKTMASNRPVSSRKTVTEPSAYVLTSVPKLLLSAECTRANERVDVLHTCTRRHRRTSQNTPRLKCVRRAVSCTGGAMITSSAPTKGVLALRNSFKAETKWFFVKHA